MNMKILIFPFLSYLSYVQQQNSMVQLFSAVYAVIRHLVSIMGSIHARAVRWVQNIFYFILSQGYLLSIFFWLFYEIWTKHLFAHRYVYDVSILYIKIRVMRCVPYCANIKLTRNQKIILNETLLSTNRVIESFFVFYSFFFKGVIGRVNLFKI